MGGGEVKQPIIFCDFDGTITNSDNIISIMKHFAPDGWEQIKNQVLSQAVTIEEGVGKMFSLLPSGYKDEIVQYVKQNATIRDGFQDFVQFTKSKNIPFYIVSGGIDFFVYPMLESFGPFQAVFCNHGDFSSENIQIKWPNPCDDHCSNGCGCCKTSIIRKLTNESHFKIVIGDSITDLEAAKVADLIIARDFLADKCKELGLPYYPFQTFNDCIGILEKELEVRV
ncbi:2-hydroxy-3-keto-5-methylthiopentenyl-1-phosphate phosphatase [Bacillus sp. APMAM]|nr:2-hydroxy-3-keto-5-methylthiopentenyl-1-phosphate phosphatase [Heyndrickxia shackletonii]MBB2479572.1 2-hydroxy-3-keto-5-methylthiopentenyl-1-phosphate phosphatase [Bacillus sp. APMAM]NEY99509.1 2-hydroxy-3-keto-5-methylthiopentenyl-1-phosphate phosphatase [Heyndrickxia shackletonii]RTZ57413.1 2-hydroxy-3-keto-5-methylthiopentenyl-1-phosphate phosphatase [Bacillus sp. SAJ1]